MGLPPLEAGYLNVPVVVSNIRPLNELVSPRTALLIDINKDPELQAIFIQKYLQSRESGSNVKRMHQRVITKYTGDIIFEQHILPLIEQKRSSSPKESSSPLVRASSSVQRKRMYKPRLSPDRKWFLHLIGSLDEELITLIREAYQDKFLNNE